jgi:DNA-binding PadR family transcriptional regulator
MSTPARATTTSYAILGLLAVRSWTTYELTQQMDRSLGRIWPRAASKLYEEPKKLVALGWARAADERIGKRPRTIYSITAKGRRALARWLQEPGAGPVLEWEQLLKIQFADQGTRADALATLAAAREWAIERNEENLAAGRAYAAGTGPFQERAAVNSLNGRFLTDLYAMVRDWSEWATAIVETWPDDPRAATVDQAEMDESVRRAERTARR